MYRLIKTIDVTEVTLSIINYYLNDIAANLLIFER